MSFLSSIKDGITNVVSAPFRGVSEVAQDTRTTAHNVVEDFNRTRHNHDGSWLSEAFAWTPTGNAVLQVIDNANESAGGKAVVRSPPK